jgi:tetratricopeptide (TPR) repeat protein
MTSAITTVPSPSVNFRRRLVVGILIIAAGIGGYTLGVAQRPASNPLPIIPGQLEEPGSAASTTSNLDHSEHSLLANSTVVPQVPPLSSDAPAADRAEELFRAGRFDDALKLLEQAASADPSRYPGPVALAELFARNGQAPAARFHLEKAAAVLPSHPAVYILSGRFALLEGRITDALLALQHAETLCQDPQWQGLAASRFLQEIQLGRAQAFEARENWPAAGDQYRALLQRNPKLARAHDRLGAVLFQLNAFDEAEQEFRTAAAADPSLDPPELRLAWLWMLRGDDDQTERWFQAALKAHRGNPVPARTYAGWLLERGRISDAVPCIEMAQKIDPHSRETRTLQGLHRRYSKDYTSAEGIFEELYRLDPNDTSAAWNLALTLAEANEEQKRHRAVTLAETEARKHPQSMEAYAVLGWCYYKAGRLAEAEKALTVASAAGGVRPDTAYFLARLLSDQGKQREAITLLKNALAKPGPFAYRPDAIVLLSQLEKTRH